MKTADFKPEVLAPAGDMERFEAALLFGADAVYLGGKQHTMRAGPPNFTTDELKAACTLAHEKGKKVYLTCNTLPRNADLEGLSDYLRQSAECGVDAFIVSDIGIMMEALRTAPGVPIHISTQAGVTNYLTARELYNLGASRMVLARELTLEEIKTLRQNTPRELEIECFVHGAICVSFSGRCLLSQYLNGRDANRGECSQPCRWKYRLVEEKRPGQYFPVYEEDDWTYLLNAKDLCTIEQIGLLAEAGVTSLKIEGRAKSAYYVSVITNAYRNAVDLWADNPQGYCCPDWLKEEVCKVSHREYSPGFLFGMPEQGQCYRSGGYIRNWEVAAVVEGYNPENARLLCRQRNKFGVGDHLEALIPQAGTEQFAVSSLFDEQGVPINDLPHPMMFFWMPYPRELPKGTILRREKEQTD